MGEPLAITFIPTGRAGPASGRLFREADRLEVVTGLLRNRVHLTRRIWDLLECGAGPAAALTRVGWLTPDARSALEATAAEDPSAVRLALCFGDPATEETWLFRGPANSLVVVARNLRAAITEIRSGRYEPAPDGVMGELGLILGGLFPGL